MDTSKALEADNYMPMKKERGIVCQESLPEKLNLRVETTRQLIRFVVMLNLVTMIPFEILQELQCHGGHKQFTPKGKKLPLKLL